MAKAMRTITNEELKDILDKHRAWLDDKEYGEKADLSEAYLPEIDLCKTKLYGANLSGACLSGACLSRVDLSGADLSGANLYGTDLFDANLFRTHLSGANLSGADLSGANLSGADLSGADLSYANLCKANLSDANFYRANLSYANLSGACLSEACLSGACLYGTDLFHANLSGASITDNILNRIYPICCPESGSFIGWKKCLGDRIVKLEILKDAKRLSSTGRKCRCSAAKVLAIESLCGDFCTDACVSSYYDSDFIYKVGEVVSVDDFDDNRKEECSRGIHFFITRQEAVDYSF